MGIVEWIGVGFLAVLCVLTILFVRRELIARGGSIEVSLRLSTYVEGRGWSPGIGRFVGDEFRWYRIFSFAIRPRRVIDRRMLSVQQRRRPQGEEQHALPADAVVLRCVSQREPVEIAMAETTVTGFLSWLEASPPGGASARMAAR
jgi:uncharacterized protein DUF2550